MLRVCVFVNFTKIIDTHVVRIKGDAKADSVNTYCLPDGRKIKHRYGDGAAKLAIKMLRRVETKR